MAHISGPNCETTRSILAWRSRSCDEPVPLPPTLHMIPGASSMEQPRAVSTTGEFEGVLASDIVCILNQFEIRLLRSLDDWISRQSLGSDPTIKDGKARPHSGGESQDSPRPPHSSRWARHRECLHETFDTEIFAVPNQGHPRAYEEENDAANDGSQPLPTPAQRPSQGIATKDDLEFLETRSESFQTKRIGAEHPSLQAEVEVVDSSASNRSEDAGVCKTFSEEDQRRLKAAKRKAKDDTRGPTLMSMQHQGRVEALVSSHYFELGGAVLIVCSAIVMGVEVEIEAQHPGEPLPITMYFLGTFFTSVFVLELLLRLYGLKFRLFASDLLPWTCMDIVVVASSVAETGVQTLIELGLLDTGGVEGVGQVRIFRILRGMRLLRSLRMTRILRLVASLRTLVASVVATLQSLLWALLLLLMLIYILAIVFTQASTDYAITTGYDLSIREFWGTLPVSMLTLFEAISGGISWHEVIEPLRGISPWLVALFTLYIFFTCFAMLNVITGVFCQSAMDAVNQDPDLCAQAVIQRKSRLIEKLEDLFRSVDRDMSGEVNIVELEKLFFNERMRAYLAAMGVDVQDAWTMFRLMDANGDHSITEDEFVSGVLRLSGHAKSIDIHSLLEKQKWLTNRLVSFEQDVCRKLDTAGSRSEATKSNRTSPKADQHGTSRLSQISQQV